MAIPVDNGKIIVAQSKKFVADKMRLTDFQWSDKFTMTEQNAGEFPIIAGTKIHAILEADVSLPITVDVLNLAQLKKLWSLRAKKHFKNIVSLLPYPIGPSEKELWVDMVLFLISKIANLLYFEYNTVSIHRFYRYLDEPINNHMK